MFNPIFIPISSDSHEKPLEKCPKCGHEYYKKDEDDNNQTPFWMKVLLFLLVVVLITLVLWIIDSFALNARYTNNMLYKDECNFEVPVSYKIVSNGKMFAVKVNNSSNEYLYNGRYGIETMNASITEPSLFFTECKAKAYLKAFLDSQKPKINGFK